MPGQLMRARLGCGTSAIGLLAPGLARLPAKLQIVKGLGVGGALGAFFWGQQAVRVHLFLETVHRRCCSGASVSFPLRVKGRGSNLPYRASVRHVLIPAHRTEYTYGCLKRTEGRERG